MSWWSTDFQICHLFALMLLINLDISFYNTNALMFLCLLLGNLLFLPCKMQTFVKQIKAQTVSLVYMTHTNSLVSLWTPVQVYKCPWPWWFPSLGQQWLGMSSYPCCLLTLWFPVKVLCSSPCRGWGTINFSELTIQPPANIVSSYRKFKKKKSYTFSNVHCKAPK